MAFFGQHHGISLGLPRLPRFGPFGLYTESHLFQALARWLLEVDQVGVVIRSGGAPSASMKTAFIDIRNFRTERYGCERLMPLG